MPYAELSDDGRQVSVDLHGLRIEEAISLIHRTIQEARRRGRATVRLIHGSSTSSNLYQNRTIKNEVVAMLEDGSFGPIGSLWKTDGYVVFSLPVGRVPDRRLIRLSDVF